MKKSDIDGVRIVTFVSKECWKMLKIGAIQKDLTLQLMIKDVLERAMAKNGKKVTEPIGDTIE